MFIDYYVSSLAYQSQLCRQVFFFLLFFFCIMLFLHRKNSKKYFGSQLCIAFLIVITVNCVSMKLEKSYLYIYYLCRFLVDLYQVDCIENFYIYNNHAHLVQWMISGFSVAADEFVSEIWLMVLTMCVQVRGLLRWASQSSFPSWLQTIGPPGWSVHSKCAFHIGDTVLFLFHDTILMLDTISPTLWFLREWNLMIMLASSKS